MPLETDALSRGARPRDHPAAMRRGVRRIACTVRQGVPAGSGRRGAVLLGIAGAARQWRAVPGPDLARRTWLRCKAGARRGDRADQCLWCIARKRGDAGGTDAAERKAVNAAPRRVSLFCTPGRVHCDPPRPCGARRKMPVESTRLELLTALARKVLWLSSWTIHHANHVRTSGDGLKVGGHQASSASLVTIMSALYFSVLKPEDRVAVKPHASPVFHAKIGRAHV